MMTFTAERAVLALGIAGLLSAPALADSTSGSGAAYAIHVGTESVSIIASSQSGDIVIHVRNVGSRPATIRFVPQCSSGSQCDPGRTLLVKPVTRDNDSSRDGSLRFSASARTFAWTISE